MTGVHIKRGNLDTHTHTHTHTRRTACEDAGRDWSEASTHQGMLKIFSKPPEARREVWNRFFLTALRVPILLTP